MSERVVASRKLKAVDANGKAFDLQIVIGLPFEVSPDEWACPVSLEGLFKHRGSVFGVDSLQALLLAIKFVKDLLQDFDQKGGKFYWFDNGGPVSLDDLLHL